MKDISDGADLAVFHLWQFYEKSNKSAATCEGRNLKTNSYNLLHKMFREQNYSILKLPGGSVDQENTGRTSLEKGMIKNNPCLFIF